MGRIKRIVAISIAIVIVLAAGVIVGQAPALFGSEVVEDPEASIEFTDQRGDGTSVTVDHVELSDGGFVVVTDGAGTILGVSDALEAGSHENVTVDRHEETEQELFGELTVVVHRDTTDDGEFVYEETDGEEDRPYLEAGYPVSNTATVTSEDRLADEAARTSFQVESTDGPASVTTEETLSVDAEISNPNVFETNQPVDLRVDGEVLEQQVVDLGPEESTELTLEADAGLIEPGNVTYGVYTAGDGEIDELEVVYGGPATVEFESTDVSGATVNASLPDDGFVAVENETGEAIATTDALERGEHEGVDLEFEDTLEDGETVTAVVYEGDPDDLEDATAFTDDDERVDATATVAPDAE